MAFSIEDKDLVQNCIAGKRESQYILYKRYRQSMYNLCNRMLRDKYDAEDVLQVAFVQVFGKIKEYRYESTIGAWIKRIVVNNCINHMRKNQIQFDPYDGQEIVECESVDVNFNVDSIKKAISLLPDGYRMIFCLYVMEGYDHGEIGQILQISESTSKSQYSRARAKLIQIMHDNGTINKIFD